jgi:hypothetical protein
MVEKPNSQPGIPPTSEPSSMRLQQPGEPATVVSGMPGIGQPIKQGPLYRDGAPPSKFKLPESVTPAEIKDQSYRYGGGRSAGRKSTEP